MTALLESPLPILLFGIVVLAGLGIALLRTGRGVLLAAMAGVVLLVAAGLALEWLVVTDGERIEATLEGVAEAIQANDLERTQAYCTESNTQSRSEAARAMRMVEFTEIKITDLDITVNDLTSPPTATALFTARVTARDKAGLFDGAPHLIGFTLKLRRESGDWLISGHDLKNAPAGF
ncbi:MAG TPA: hypothetical protein VE890_05285 [Thermoguttaceae bacterium]|nr:hypothetical protein [Thermoguttaceae bacterium]